MLAMLAAFGAATFSDPALNLVPLPRSVAHVHGPSTVALRAIWPESPKLLPLAQLLAGEIQRIHGRSIRIEAEQQGPGRVSLSIDRRLGKEAYRLETSPKLQITGGSYEAVAMGTATLIQLTRIEEGLVSIPPVVTKDSPSFGYRGLLVDVARQSHSIASLEQIIELCRLYKVRYLQLHLTDDQSFTFPTERFPELSTPGRSYSKAELKCLVEFARIRGVTIIPEIEMPGHCAQLVSKMPELFRVSDKHHATINFANPKVVDAMEALLAEAAAIFHTSPFLHIGGDEADLTHVMEHPDFQAAAQRTGWTDPQPHFRSFLAEMERRLRKRGKQMLVWEGFGRGVAPPLPKDLPVMVFESAYYLPTHLIEDGQTIINTAWTPLYVVNRHAWHPRRIYEWSPTQFGRFSTTWAGTTWFEIAESGNLIGAQMCSWEQPEALELASLRERVAAFAERIWHVEHRETFDRFETRLQATDRVLHRLLGLITFEARGLEPRQLNRFDVKRFASVMEIKLGLPPGAAVARYTLDGSPAGPTSTIYGSPIVLTETTTLRAAAFDADGRRVGYETGDVFVKEALPKPNLASGKPVTSSAGTQGPQTPDLAVDNDRSLGSSWRAGPAPQWLQVDLEKPEAIGRIVVVPYWDGRRAYRYRVETSLDGRTWTLALDRRENTQAASESGETVDLKGRRARYIRVTMLSNSANEAVHLVELEVWPP